MPVRWIVAIAIATAACARPAARGGVVVDDFGDSVRAGPARRIVSLNPVMTEFVFAAGAGDRLVGRTHWDHYPPAANAVPDLGDGMSPNVEVILGASPDLVLAYASEANRRAVAALRAVGVRTLTVRTDRLADLPRFARLYAAVTGDSGGIAAADTALGSVDAVRALPRRAPAPRVFWIVYDGGEQVYALGAGSFLSEIVTAAGGVNIFADLAAPSAQVSIEEVVRRDPDAILAGPVTAARLRTMAAWRAVRAVRLGHVLVTDTALVERPGVRIGEAARHVRRLLETLP